jgi:serine/threonine-protein kinase
MPAPQHVTRRTFLANLKRSGLLSPEQYADASDLVPDTERGRLLARALVDRGWLTRFQAERLLVGRTTGYQLDQYVILEELGRGGMGRVYKARHRTMNRIVALKVLAPDLTSSERAQEMFLREVRAAAQLMHPNIVTAYDANRAGDRYYLVLEYVDGPNLDQLVKASGPLAIGQACDFIRQAAQGLQCAHAAGMVHRDIKPANILVQGRAADGSPGLLKISDFGLARLGNPTGDGTNQTIMNRPNTVMGTPDFLSPEQARCMHRIDIRSDVYSLGCTFYYLLTGQVPFPGGSSLDKLLRHGKEELTPVEQFRSDVPPEVLAILRKMTAKDPQERYQTPGEVAAALEPFSVSGPTPWEPVFQTLDPAGDQPAPVGVDDSDPVMLAAKGLEGTISPENTPRADSAIPARDELWPPRRRRGRLLLMWTLFLVALAAGITAAYLLLP